MHLSDEQLQRLLHDELAADVATRWREHVQTCAACDLRVTEARQDEAELFQLLGTLDHSPPALSADVVAARAHDHRAPRLRWAAGIVLAVGAASVVYALPDSRLRVWVHGLLGDEQNQPRAAEPVRAPPAATAGIALVPGERLVIQFTSARGGQARVILADGDEVVVRAMEGDASFTAQADRLVVDNHNPAATFEIRIPRAAPQVVILAGSHRLFSKQEARITSRAARHADGSYSLQLGVQPD